MFISTAQAYQPALLVARIRRFDPCIGVFPGPKSEAGPATPPERKNFRLE